MRERSCKHGETIIMMKSNPKPNPNNWTSTNFNTVYNTMGRLSKSIQDRVYELAWDWVTEDEKVCTELDLSEENYNTLPNRATLKCLRGLGIISGYHAFMKNGMRKIKVPTLWKNTKEVADTWKALSKEEQGTYCYGWWLMVWESQ